MVLDYKGAAVVAVVGVAVLWFVSRKAGEAVKVAAEAVNPTNRDNIFYSGVNAIGDALDDSDNNESFSLGSWVYDITH